MHTVGKSLLVLACCAVSLGLAGTARGAGLEDLLKTCRNVKKYEAQKKKDGTPDPTAFYIYLENNKWLEIYLSQSDTDPNVKFYWVSGLVKRYSGKEPSDKILARVPKLNENSKFRPGSMSVYKWEGEDQKTKTKVMNWDIMVNFYLPADATDDKTLDSYIGLTNRVRDALSTVFDLDE